jgi:hypothetical protein
MVRALVATARALAAISRMQVKMLRAASQNWRRFSVGTEPQTEFRAISALLLDEGQGLCSLGGLFAGLLER